MELVEYDWPSKWDCAYIIPISDTHIGDPRFNRGKLDGYIDWILERPNAFTILNGDILDVAITESVGDTYDAKMNTNEALKYARELFDPLSDRILGVTEGNHERRVSKKTSVDVMEILADYLDVPYRPEGMYFKFRLGKGANGKKIVYTGYFTHGTGGGRTTGGKANKIQYLSDIVLADILSIGHIHKMLTFQDVLHVPDLYNNNIRQVKRTYVSSGAYLEWGGYAERKEYPPSKIGSPRIRLSGESSQGKDVHVSI